VDVPEAARRFYELGERLGLGGLRDALLALPTRNRWEKIALRSLVVELRQLQVALSVRYLESGAGTPDAFLGGCPHLLKRFDATLSDVRRSDELGLASGGVLRGTLQALLSEL
jgi:NAD-specific glutamate dehydrogenase